MLISYGLVARVFNRNLNQPLPPHLSKEGLSTVQRVINMYRVYYLGVYAPLKIVGLNVLKPGLFQVVFNSSESTYKLVGEKGPENKSLLGFISSYYKKLNK
jgi:hypothetical protein